MEHSDLAKEKEQAINESLQNEYERNIEEERLEYAREVIKGEILNYISKRKEFSQYILDYRKDALDEYKDDEDKVAEYFDHERFVKEEAFKTIDRRLKELLILENSPYFGRVDFSEAGEEESETIYVGRFGVTPEGTYEPLVVDWRAPIAAMFYSGKLGRAVYSAPMGEVEVDIKLKRQYVIKRGHLIGMFDSAVDIKDDILQMVLSENTSQKLKDIIMTIQEEQDNIIRQPREKTVVVNGVAGSGKTTIALHRVAYLLYNYRDKLQDKVLILGPNSIFMEYISMVLPSLGESGVKQRSFKDYAMEILKLDYIMPFKDYMEAVMQGEDGLIKDILYKSSESFIEKLDKKALELDEGYFQIKDVYLFDTLVISASEIRELFQKHYSSMPLFRRSKKVRRIIFSRIKDVRDDIFRSLQREHKKRLAEMSPGELKANENHLEFMRKNKIRELIRAVLDTKEGLKWLANPSLLETYSNINGDKELIYDDLAPLLYLMLKLEGNMRMEDIRHVVIDEAQDYSTLQFKVIRELTGCSSMTVVGDVNQRLLPYEGTIPMTRLEDILPELDIEHYGLEKSYRSTREIMEYANRFLVEDKIVPLVRSGEAVRVIEYSDYSGLKAVLGDCINVLKKKGYENIAVISRDLKTAGELGGFIREDLNIKIVDDEELIFSGGTVLMPSYYAKGLEFDAVLIIEELTENEPREAKVNYVMCTRALHELIVLKRKR
ncbi:MAG: AAA family ATPase [Bacillota bacterium]|nr:AAA family ATPase [Bacillota bacterium]